MPTAHAKSGVVAAVKSVTFRAPSDRGPARAGSATPSKQPKKKKAKAATGRSSKGKKAPRIKSVPICVEHSADMSTAVLHRLPPTAAPPDIDAFDQQTWLAQQQALTQQMFRMYSSDNWDDGGGDVPFDEEDDEEEDVAPAWNDAANTSVASASSASPLERVDESDSEDVDGCLGERERSGEGTAGDSSARPAGSDPSRAREPPTTTAPAAAAPLKPASGTVAPKSALAADLHGGGDRWQHAAVGELSA